MWGECPSVDGRWARNSHEPEDGRASTMHGAGAVEVTGLDEFGRGGFQWPSGQQRTTHADRRPFVRAWPGSSELNRRGLR